MINQLPSYNAVSLLANKAKNISLRQLFQEDSNRFDAFSVQGPHLFLDYSKNLVTQESLNVLIELLKETKFLEKRNSLFNGKALSEYHLNNTENRQVLHTALRLPDYKLLSRSNDPSLPPEDIRNEIFECRTQIKQFVNKVHDGALKGYNGKPLKTIVSLGIGGSFLGPKMATKALTPFAKEGYECHYIANIDSTDFYEVIHKVNIEETIFLIQSKSFGTIETLYNANAVKDFLIDKGLSKEDMSHHFYAVTSNIEKAVKFGINKENIFPMWDWVGGRYSLWSAIGIPIAFFIGYENFEKLLKGAYEMDQHFLTAELDKNIPVILAVLGIWYHNFFDANNHAVLPYSHYLRYLPHHLQQLDMESNGKQVTITGQKVSSNTGPIVWGGEGTNGQHAYHQLLHQGTHLIPCDFLMSLRTVHPISDHHRLLTSNCLSQTKALMEGKTHQQALDELLASGMDKPQADKLAPHRVYEGNRPSNTIVFDILSPEVTGALIAAYEHKVFVQGVVWGINSFDQWGVELGKSLGNDIYNMLNIKDDEIQTDTSTKGLIEMYRNANKS